jgi:hypothetical protein
MEDPDSEEYKARDRAFYSARVGAWLNTKELADPNLNNSSASSSSESSGNSQSSDTSSEKNEG